MDTFFTSFTSNFSSSVTNIPTEGGWGAAKACDNGLSPGHAGMNLQGTPFAVKQMKWRTTGYNFEGTYWNVTYSSSNQVLPALPCLLGPTTAS